MESVECGNLYNPAQVKEKGPFVGYGCGFLSVDGRGYPMCEKSPKDEVGVNVVTPLRGAHHVGW